MFYFYGRKKRLAKEYPQPLTTTIVEPFAGSAAYSLHGQNWENRVILIEKDAEVAALWRWLRGAKAQAPPRPPTTVRNYPPASTGCRLIQFFFFLCSSF